MSAFFGQAMTFVSDLAIPLMLFLIIGYGFVKKVRIYESFVDGAKGGFDVAIKIIPFLVAILVAIGMFRASGAMDIFVTLISPLTNLIGLPAEALPVALMRPLSGSGTLGLVSELMKTYGPDSFIGRLTSTMYGSTETTFYVLAVYFGSVGIKKTRHAVPAGLLADTAGLLAALFICRLVFG
jgi:spore maturation protein B